MLELKQQLISSLGEHVPAHSEISTFNVGYLKKPAQSKQWLITERDLETMYAQSGEEISIWCDHRCEDSSTLSTSAIQGSKRTGTSAHTATETPATKRQKSTNYSR